MQLYTAAGQPAQHRGSQALIRNVRGKQDVAALAWHPALPLLVVAWLDGEKPCDTVAMRLPMHQRCGHLPRLQLCLFPLAMQVMLAMAPHKGLVGQCFCRELGFIDLAVAG